MCKGICLQMELRVEALFRLVLRGQFLVGLGLPLVGQVLRWSREVRYSGEYNAFLPFLQEFQSTVQVMDLLEWQPIKLESSLFEKVPIHGFLEEGLPQR